MKFARGKLVDEVARRWSSSGLESALRMEFKKKPVQCHICQKPGHKRKDCRQWLDQQKVEETEKVFSEAESQSSGRR